LGPMSERVIRPVRRSFRAIARAVVPETEELDAMVWEEMEAIIETALRDRPSGVRRQLRLFIRIVQILPILRYGMPFTRLDAERANRFLRGLQDSRLLLFRRGFWGVRTLVFMGYYGLEPVRRSLGYRADPRGWDAYRERQPGGGA